MFKCLFTFSFRVAQSHTHFKTESYCIPSCSEIFCLALAPWSQTHILHTSSSWVPDYICIPPHLALIFFFLAAHYMAVHDLFGQFPRDAYVTGTVCCSDAHFTGNSATHRLSHACRQIPGEGLLTQRADTQD